jgi:hypothetical protein
MTRPPESAPIERGRREETKIFKIFRARAAEMKNRRTARERGRPPEVGKHEKLSSKRLEGRNESG